MESLLVLVILLILAGGYGYYQSAAKSIRSEKFNDLSTIANMKAGQIGQWKKGYMADTWRAANGPVVAKNILALRSNPGAADLQSELHRILVVNLKENLYANALLLTADGLPLLAAKPDSAPLDPVTKRTVEAARAAGKPVMSDFFRHPDGHIYLDAAATVPDPEGRPLATLILRVNADDYLYSLLQSWPAGSQSAETQLVQRQGDDAVILNALRHRPSSALNLRIPMSNRESPAVQAILGKQGAFQGQDYRGVEVLADLRPIPDTPWHLITKADASEILSEARYRAKGTALVVTLLILLVIAFFTFAHHQHQAAFYRDRYEAERQRREAQDELIQERNKLEAAYADSKRREEQLRKTAEELVRSNRELERFAYISSHDLNEPLRMVSAFTKLLRDRYKGRLDATADQYIVFALEGAERMRALIADLLDYSRVGRRETLKRLNAREPLRAALDNLKPAIEAAGARIEADPMPEVTADSGQLTQIFQNLIGNAIKFHGPEPPRIKISAVRLETAWQFSVQDNGIGIDPQYWSTIFEIFQRLHTQDQYTGTGIGLAICKKIIESHGGRIWVESIPGSGSTFHFTIS